MPDKYHFLKFRAVAVVFVLLILGFSLPANPLPGSTPEVVVVRESDLRFGPVPLPLDGKVKLELRKYLKSGGDKMNPGTVGFYDDRFYTGLLTFLSGKTEIRVEDLLQRGKGFYRVHPRVRLWFGEPVTFTVVDATQKRPAAEKSFGPFALFDGHLWWVFYRDKKNRVTDLLVTVPLTGKLRYPGTGKK